MKATPVRKPLNADQELIHAIAAMAQCGVCFPNGPHHARTGFCSKHQDPIRMANGHLYGWEDGKPRNYP